MIGCLNIDTNSRPKQKKFPDGYPGDAFDSSDNESVSSAPRVYTKPRRLARYMCHNCKAIFVHGDPKCPKCGHEKCLDCARVPPRKVKPQPDAEVVRKVEERLKAMGMGPSETEQPPDIQLPEQLAVDNRPNIWRNNFFNINHLWSLLGRITDTYYLEDHFRKAETNWWGNEGTKNNFGLACYWFVLYMEPSTEFSRERLFSEEKGVGGLCVFIIIGIYSIKWYQVSNIVISSSSFAYTFGRGKIFAQIYQGPPLFCVLEKFFSIRAGIFWGPWPRMVDWDGFGNGIR